MELNKSKTIENLKRGFLSECAARTRYEFMEYGQRFKGYEGLATITDKIAYQEFNHARMFYTKIQSATNKTINIASSTVTLSYREKWDIEKNLMLASQDEGDEAEFYKMSSKVAKEEGFEDISTLFTLIANAEIKHKKIFTFLYEKMKEDKLYSRDKKERWICPSCGYEEVGEKAFETCPLCNAKIDTLTIILPKELQI